MGGHTDWHGEQLTPAAAKAVGDFLGSHTTMTLATSGADGPWAAALFYAHDSDLRIGWRPMTKHTFATWLPGAVACLVLAVGCNSVGPVPSVEGTIVEVTSDPLLILVKPSPSHCGAWALVDSRTEIRIKTSGDFPTLPADSDRLRVGVMVSVWGDDELFQLSCPGEGRADRVIIES